MKITVRLINPVGRNIEGVVNVKGVKGVRGAPAHFYRWVSIWPRGGSPRICALKECSI